MNEYMNRFALSAISYFDVGGKPSDQVEPERFYHGFVLGLLVDLRGRYEVLSNRESGFGRYDVMLKPLNDTDDGIILEFKVYNARKEKDLQETVQAALQQIQDKKYDQSLLDQGIAKERIRQYGFAFRGKEILIGDGSQEDVADWSGLGKALRLLEEITCLTMGIPLAEKAREVELAGNDIPEREEKDGQV